MSTAHRHSSPTPKETRHALHQTRARSPRPRGLPRLAPARDRRRLAAFQARPSSKVRGVMIGMNVPYNFGGRSLPVDDIIRNCVELGISGVELRTQPVEAFLGAPPAPPAPPGRHRTHRPSRRPHRRPAPRSSASGGSRSPWTRSSRCARSSRTPASSSRSSKSTASSPCPTRWSITSSSSRRRSGPGRSRPRSPSPKPSGSAGSPTSTR